MLVRRLLIAVCIVVSFLFGVAACGPVAQRQNSAAVSTPATETDMATVTETQTITESETITNEVQNSEEGNIVDETTTSDEELVAAPPGHTDPVAAGEGSQNEPQGSGEHPLPSEMLVYTDSTYGFSVEYPASYVFRTEPAEKLASLDPQPIVSFVMINPTLAASDIADLELADIEIRVLPAEGAASLQAWLAAHGFLEEGNLPAKQFQTATVTGLEVCASTMIAPGCSYFVLGDGLVYQMVPTSLEGEAIMNRFSLVR